jgi:hypothetical protein
VQYKKKSNHKDSLTEYKNTEQHEKKKKKRTNRSKHTQTTTTTTTNTSNTEHHAKKQQLTAWFTPPHQSNRGPCHQQCHTAGHSSITSHVVVCVCVYKRKERANHPQPTPQRPICHLNTHTYTQRTFCHEYNITRNKQ